MPSRSFADGCSAAGTKDQSGEPERAATPGAPCVPHSPPFVCARLMDLDSDERRTFTKT
jgi:hypothetical protein